MDYVDTIINLVPQLYFMALFIVDMVRLYLPKRSYHLKGLLDFLPIAMFLLYLAVAASVGIAAVSTLLENHFSRSFINIFSLITLTLGYQLAKHFIYQYYRKLGVRTFTKQLEIMISYLEISLSTFLFYGTVSILITVVNRWLTLLFK